MTDREGARPSAGGAGALLSALVDVYGVAHDAMLYILENRDRPDLIGVFQAMSRAYDFLPEDAKARFDRPIRERASDASAIAESLAVNNQQWKIVLDSAVAGAGAAEREACAGIADHWWGADHRGGTCNCLPCELAARIRQRASAASPASANEDTTVRAHHPEKGSPDR